MPLPNIYNLGHSAGYMLGRMLSNQSLPPMPSPEEAWGLMVKAPSMYKEWWLNLVTKDPIHVFIETTLVLSLIYMVISGRTKDWRDELKKTLTRTEEEELLKDWKENGRTPLAPPLNPDDNNTKGKNNKQQKQEVVVQSMNGRTMEIRLGDEKRNRTVLNLATHDFLGMASNQAIKDTSRDALSKYGCGSCGPRGFYGTIDVHLDLEDAISKFTHTEGAIMYSDGASTCTSTVAAFAKRGDLIVADDGIYEPLLAGITLSRANVIWFRHNDMADLRRVLESVQKKDKELGRKHSDQRRFIVVEGLYKNSGTIVPFDELVALKHEFSYRLMLDESFSFGTLGKTGRGVVEMYGKRHMYDAEIVTISLENSLGSIGGVTVGNDEVVDHQRLSGAGYCFSASSPPFTASAAIEALAQLENSAQLLASFKRNQSYLYTKLQAMLKAHFKNKLVVTSHEQSPLVFVELKGETSADPATVFDAVAEKCLLQGLALLSVSRSLSGNNNRPNPPPALRLTVSSALKQRDVDEALSILKKALQSVKM